MKKRFVPFFITILIFVSGLSCYAANKTVNRKLQKILNEVEHSFSKDDFSNGISLCHKLLLKTDFNDPAAFQVRSLLTEYYLAANSLNEIYECGVYFREYLKSFPDDERAAGLKERCDERYAELLGEEALMQIPAGVYISEVFSDNSLPYLAIEVAYDKYGGMTARLLPCCRLSQQANSYSYTKAKNSLGLRAAIMATQDSTAGFGYFAEWGDLKIRDGNADLAKSINRESYKFGKNMTGAIASSKESTSEKIQVSVATGMVTGLFDFVADELSKKTVKSHAVFLGMDSVTGGIMPCVLKWHTRTSRDGETPQEDMNTVNTRLHRIYPHDELLFCCPSNASAVTYRSVHNSEFPSDSRIMMSGFSDKYIEESEVLTKRIFPAAYPEGNIHKRKIPKAILSAKKINKIFYDDFVRYKLGNQ